MNSSLLISISMIQKLFFAKSVFSLMPSEWIKSAACVSISEDCSRICNAHWPRQAIRGIRFTEVYKMDCFLLITMYYEDGLIYLWNRSLLKSCPTLLSLFPSFSSSQLNSHSPRCTQGARRNQIAKSAITLQDMMIKAHNEDLKKLYQKKLMRVWVQKESMKPPESLEATLSSASATSLSQLLR